MDDLIKALTIFRKYGNPKFPTHCEHDVLQVDVRYSSVSEEDRAALAELSFVEDQEAGCFCSFRFGSC